MKIVLQMSAMEFVWVVPRTALFPRAAVHGFKAMGGSEQEKRFLQTVRESGFFIERRYAETHPEFKQPIPYVAITCEDKVFTMTRLTGGEARLHGKRSIGVGGHINPCDAPPSDQDGLLSRACMRELEEELFLPDGLSHPTPLGLLNDDATDVGAVHVGLVYQLQVTPHQAHEIGIRETDGMTGGFQPYSELLATAQVEESSFETWSTLLLRSGALASCVEAVPA